MNRDRWDVDALRSGATVALLFAVPLSIGASWAGGRDDASLALWLSIGAVIGFVLGAGCAAWLQRRDLPLTHGLATAVGTYTLAQTVFVVVRLARGNDVNWFAAFFNLSVMVGAGVVGGFLGQRLRDRGFAPSSRPGTSGGDPGTEQP